MADLNHIPICVLPHAAGWHVASWRRPWAIEKDIWNIDVWAQMAKTAERGKLDAVFLADLVALWPTAPHLRHLTAHVGQWEAFTLLSALAMVTDRIGLVATVLAQAGSSGPGKQLAARIGEIIFTPHSGESAKAYNTELKEIAASFGRDPATMKVLSQITPVVAPTQTEADAKWDELQTLANPELARATVEAMLGVDLSSVPLDERVPEDIAGIIRVTGYHDAVMHYIKTEKPTVRELIHKYKGPGTVVGTPQVVADYIENEVDSGNCDGFVLLIQGMPEELEDFVDLVIPELQTRGRFRLDYEGTTLREHLGLARPANQFAGREEAIAIQESWNALT